MAIRGAQHDMAILRQSGLLNQAGPTAKIVGDKGYIGKLGVVTPARRAKKSNSELASLEDESTRRHELESERAAIENFNSRLKQWAIIRGPVRLDQWDVESFDPVFRVVSALTNLILAEHPLRRAA